MRTIYDKQDRELAQIINIKEYMNGTKSQFYTEPTESLQVGCLYFKQDSTAEPHIHRAKNDGKLYPIVELILVLYGNALLDIYDEEKHLVETMRIGCGDLLILKRGGHGYTFESPTKLLDIRGGKYPGKENDKEMI